MPETTKASGADLFGSKSDSKRFEMEIPGRVIASFTTTSADGSPIVNRQTGDEEPSFKSFMLYSEDENGKRDLIYCSWAQNSSGYLGGWVRGVWNGIVGLFQGRNQAKPEDIPEAATTDAAKASGDQEEFPD